MNEMTTQFDAMSTVLTQKTPRDQVKQRKGRGGKMFDYVDHSYVTQVLNKAFNWQWSWEVTNYQIFEGVEVIVQGKLTIHSGQEIIKMQFGQQDYLKNRQGEIVMSTGDALKGASSDALKKCASLLGIALDLYGGSVEPAVKKASKPAPKKYVDGMPISFHQWGNWVEYTIKNTPLNSESEIVGALKNIGVDRITDMNGKKSFEMMLEKKAA